MIAVIAPHAGYLYSGKFAGDVYRRVEIPERVLLLCPNHTGQGKRISIWSQGSWETPLGNLPVDSAFAAKLLEAWPEARTDRDAHVFEHAIEVHLPFLKWLRSDVKIVPITLGPLQLETCETLGEKLADTIEAESTPTLIVASTDMSHYLSAAEAKTRDAYALRAVEALTPAGLYRIIREKEISMCGFIPTTVALAAALKLGAKKAEVVCYGHSGEASGDLNRVVAYAGAVVE